MNPLKTSMASCVVNFNILWLTELHIIEHKRALKILKVGQNPAENDSEKGYDYQKEGL